VAKKAIGELWPNGISEDLVNGQIEQRVGEQLKRMGVTPATAFEGKTARGNLGWWWLRVRGRHGP